MLSLFRKFKRKTLKRNIHRYVTKKQDICCETDIDRDQVIDHIFQLYSEIAGNKNSLMDIYTDFSKFIGDKETLIKQRDTRGLAVWNELDRSMYLHQELDKDNISAVFHEVPLYYLLSFLGYAYYRHKEDVVPMSPVSASKSKSPKLPSTFKSVSQTRSISPKI
jgi:hypothetical protein